MPGKVVATRRNKEQQIEGLTVAQQNAVDALACGKNDTETAELVGVHRVTVTKWRRYSLPFQAALNRHRSDIWSAGVDRLRSLLPKAMETLGELLEEGPPELRLKAALAVANLCPLEAGAFQTGPADDELLLDAETMRRRDRMKKLNDFGYFSGIGTSLPDIVRHRIMVQEEYDRELRSRDPASDSISDAGKNIPETDIALRPESD